MREPRYLWPCLAFTLLGIGLGFFLGYVFVEGAELLGPGSFAHSFHPWPWRSSTLVLAGICGTTGLVVGGCCAWLLVGAEGVGAWLGRRVAE